MIGPSFSRDKFHVITMISNPAHFNSRYILYKRFEKQMQDADVNLWVVELQLGDRLFLGEL